MIYRRKNIISRFFQYVSIKEDGGCWLWVGSLSSNGYGKFKTRYRFCYEIFKGEIGPGLQLDHLCRTRSCVNPDHLEPVSSRENIRRGENHVAKIMQSVFCKRGHYLCKDNLIKTMRNYRRCKTCNNIYQMKESKDEKIASIIVDASVSHASAIQEHN